jgi:hypothetical protein
VHDVRDVGDRQQRDLRAVKGTAAGRGARLGPGATGFLLLVVLQAGSFSNSAISAVFMASVLG